MATLVPAERIHRAILLIRCQKVMLDRDLATLYGVTTFNLNKAVKRNLQRFPADFMFQLTAEEAGALRFQFGISKGRGGTRYLPYAFTEQGVAMLSSVLRSERAIQVNVAVMRAFVGLRFFRIGGSGADSAQRQMNSGPMAMQTRAKTSRSAGILPAGGGRANDQRTKPWRGEASFTFRSHAFAAGKMPALPDVPQLRQYRPTHGGNP